MQSQMKLLNNRKYVVEYVSLYPFILGPGGGRREAVDLQRQAVRGRCQLAYHQGHVLANARVGAQVGVQIGAQCAEVGEVTAVDGATDGIAQLLVVAAQLLLLAAQIGGQQSGLLELQLLLRRQEAHTGHVDVDAALDAPATGLGHPLPVLEGVGDEGIGGDGGDGLVPVRHLDRGEADVGHLAIGAVFIHLQPVTDAQHAVGGELDPGHQAQDGVLEHQHQDCGHGPQAAEQEER